MSNTLTIRRPDDWHCHLRQGDMLHRIIRDNDRVYGRRLIMPNIRSEARPLYDGFPPPPVYTAATMVRYRDEILAALEASQTPFEPVMGIALLDETTPEIVAAAAGAGARFAKVYPKNPVGGAEMTTNAEYGVSDFKATRLQDALAALDHFGLVLCIHGEKPGSFVMDREADFLDDLRWLHATYPTLRIVLEHITTTEALECVRHMGDTVGASVTVHHLFLTLDDVVGGKIQPHTFCKPIAKRHEDKYALQNAVVEGFPRLWLGTDSAPHMRETKECAAGCAGVYVPDEVAMAVLADFFDTHSPSTQNSLLRETFERFSSEFGSCFYGYPPNTGSITLVKEPWRVPDGYAGIVPFMAGQTLNWKVCGVNA